MRVVKQALFLREKTKDEETKNENPRHLNLIKWQGLT
jgi:hypothetical protein